MRGVVAPGAIMGVEVVRLAVRNSDQPVGNLP
jgi:hypothetical protein